MPRPDGAPRPTVERFTAAQRLLHLALAVSFAGMLWTGLCLWSPALADVMGRPAAKQWHIWSAIALGAAAALLTAFRPREVAAFARAADGLDPDDVAWLRGGLRRLVDHRGAPPQGWLNAGQKLNTALTTGLLAVLAGTGVLMLLGERDTAWRFGGTVPVHDVATVLIVLLVSGHLWLALANAETRPALRGMATGRVDLDWARVHHARWVAEIEAAATADRASAPMPDTLPAGAEEDR